jgi:hypothetical protein
MLNFKSNRVSVIGFDGLHLKNITILRIGVTQAKYDPRVILTA